MNEYHVYDRIEAQGWDRHCQLLAREEREAELSDDFEKALSLHMFESLCLAGLLRCGASKKAISAAFDDDVNFQERMAEQRRLMVEAIARHQIDIESEE